MLAAGLLFLRAVASLTKPRVVVTPVGVRQPVTVADISRVQIDATPVKPERFLLIRAVGGHDLRARGDPRGSPPT